MKKSLICIVSIFLIFFSSKFVYAETNTKIIRNKDFEVNSLNSICSNKNIIVSVGDNGTIFTSKDEENWTRQNSNVISNLKDIVWNGKRFVAVGDMETILTSEDGVNWEVIIYDVNDESSYFNKVIWNGDKFVAVGNGLIYTSREGLNWARINNIKREFTDIIYCNNEFIAVSGEKQGWSWEKPEDRGVIYTSLDGLEWKEFKLKDIDGYEVRSINGIAYNGQRYVAVKNNSNIFISDDLENWKNINVSTKYSNDIHQILWDGEKFVALGRIYRDKLGRGYLYTSLDGEKWNVTDLDNGMNGINLINDYIFTVGDNKGIIKYLKDDKIKYLNKPEKITFKNVIWNGEFYSVYGDCNYILKSTNGIEWEKIKTNNKAIFNSVVWDEEKFLAYDIEGNIFISYDGVSWHKENVSNDLVFSKVVFNDKKFLAFINHKKFVNGKSRKSSEIYMSYDGVVWKKVKKIEDGHINEIKYNGKVVIAVGSVNYFIYNGDKRSTVDYDSLVYISEDAENWEKIDVNDIDEIKDIEWDGKEFLVIDKCDRILTSSDGRKWTRIGRSMPQEFNNLLELHYDGKEFIAISEFGYIQETYSSSSLFDHKEMWRPLDMATRNDLKSISSNGFNDVIVGERGTLLTLIDENKSYEQESEYNNRFSWSRNLDVDYDDLNSIVYNGEIYVAVGSDGIINTSNDSDNWNVIKTEVNETLNCVIWAKNKFIAVGDEGRILESQDGMHWSVIKSNTKVNLNSICYWNNQFIIIGDKGSILTSKHGEIWELNSSNVKQNLRRFLLDNDKLTVFGGGRYQKKVILTSTDLKNWVNEDLYIGTINDVTWNGEFYTAVGNQMYITTSKDGSVWEKEQEFDNVMHYNEHELYGITNNSEEFVVVGSNYLNCGAIILTSKDGKKWSRVGSEFDNILRDVIWDGKQFIAVGGGGQILKSDHGMKWDEVKHGHISSNISGILYKGENYIAHCNNWGLDSILTSKDGFSWVELDMNKTIGDYTNMYGIEWDGKKFLSLDGQGRLLRSSDGKEWTKIDLNTDKYLTSLCINGEKVIVVGDGIILCIDDQMQLQKYECDIRLNYVIYHDGSYIAFGEEENMLTSTDGINWSKEKSLIENNLKKITWDGKRFLALDREGKFVTSSNGKEWTKINMGIKKVQLGNSNKYMIKDMYDFCTNEDKIIVVGEEVIIYIEDMIYSRKIKCDQTLRDIIYHDGIYIALGDEGSILTSYDGINWDKEESGTKNDLNKIIWDGNKYIIIGDNRTILYGTKIK